MRLLYNNERGYTLFLTVLMATIFTIMAATLITLTMNGIQRNDIRERDTQALELAEKGLTRKIQEINDELQVKVGQGLEQEREFIPLLETTLNKYHCQSNSKLTSTNIGNYLVCVQSYNESANKPSRRIVTFKSTGIVHNHERSVYSQVEIGADPVPESLNYAIATNKCDSCPNSSDEGNLFLHGGVHIRGNLKVDGNLITTNRGYVESQELLQNDGWINSTLPNVLPSANSNSNSANLVLGGDIYTFHNNQNYSYHNNFNPNRFNQSTLVHAFKQGTSIQLANQQPVRDEIVVTDYKEEFQYGKNNADSQLKEGTIHTEQQYKNSKVIAYDEDCTLLDIILGRPCEEVTKTYKLEGTNIFRQFATNQDVIIGGGTDQASISVEDGMYVGGDLTIGNEEILEEVKPGNIWEELFGAILEFLGVVDSPDNYDDITVNGPIYVNKDLHIVGANLNINALMYVAGDVTIEHSNIRGMENRNNQGTLVIFSDGDVTIQSISQYKNEKESIIKGYFYSNESMEIEGVASNLRIEGGISAPKIVLNAVRGELTERGVFLRRFRYDNPAIQEARDDSRLEIVYDPKVVETYSELQQTESKIYKMDQPKRRSRSFSK